MSLDKIVDTTSAFLQIPAVISNEHFFMAHLAKLIEGVSSNLKIDSTSKLLVVNGENIDAPTFTVHVDRHGIIVDQEGKPEYAESNRKRAYGMKMPSEQLLDKAGKRFIDEPVFAYDSITGEIIADGKVTAHQVNGDKLTFTIDGMVAQKPGTPIAYKSNLDRSNGYISSQIDNVICVAAAYQLIEEGFSGRVIFTTEEEIGRSGIHVIDYLKQQEKTIQDLVVLDGTPYEEMKPIDDGMVILRNRDTRAIFNKDLTNKLAEVCNRLGISYEKKDEVLLLKDPTTTKFGLTELGLMIAESQEFVNGTTLQIPTTNYHTNHETTSELALSNFYNVLRGVAGFGQ